MNLCVTTAHTLPHRVTSSNPVLSDCMPTPPFECKPTVRSTSETHPGGLLRSCSAAAEPSSSTGIGCPLLSPTCCCCRSKPLPSPPLAVVLLPQSLISLSSCSSSSSDLPFVSGRTRIAKSVATAYSQPASQAVGTFHISEPLSDMISRLWSMVSAAVCRVHGASARRPAATSCFAHAACSVGLSSSSLAR